ncbi:MAG TPA: thioredoxin domain-containing protein, partial [Candidatus Manganitrophaceae bacterium]|nr:thioredoxin domain-containing protein [Candidatus Manganitrophaceae bacterium]
MRALLFFLFSSLFLISIPLYAEDLSGKENLLCNLDGKGCRIEKSAPVFPNAQKVSNPTQKGNRVPKALPVLPVGISARGPKDAPVTIIEFSDFECPFCAKFAPVIQELLEAYPDQIRFIFKHNPLPIHTNAPLAHEAALAAGAQGKFWEMHDLI